jgi:hypothetical protein
MSAESALHRIIDAVVGENEREFLHRLVDETPEQEAERNKTPETASEKLQREFDELKARLEGPSIPAGTEDTPNAE